ncbi:flagellar assembly protein FliW [Saliterribacillus persicus]|uniref:Flagellar assembly factor FliW n=1 Tax=Saliterribacillus persicus TaxID=930114 RepID=A0A368Y3P3_9BACI|nr:flagellar assembly protein FliW [Saliterribacillus persicus]RCW74725.1 flagellar assembly factor FliW [Saliterribacillus persicus]
MIIETKYFGEVDIKEEEKIHFPQGLPGFTDEKEFILLNFEDNDLFQVLQSVKQANPAFFVVNPFIFLKDFEFELDDQTIEQLKIESEEDVQVFSIVTLKDPMPASTTNLQAPIVINQKKLIAKQYITKSQKYSTKEKIFNLTSKAKGE